MASQFACECGQQIRTNLYEGNDNYLLVSEKLIEDASESNDDNGIRRIELGSNIVTFCRKCKRLHVIDRDYKITSYEYVAERCWSVWRQDDNTNEICMAKMLSESEARLIVTEFESRGHKQLYWARDESV